MKNGQKKIGIDAEGAQKILDADLKNIVQKVKSGKTLTARERSIIEGSTSSDKFAKSITDLIGLLDIGRSQFYKFKKRSDAPTDLNISEWRNFITTSKLSSGENFSPEEIIQLKAKLLSERAGREEIERKLKEIKLDREEKGFVPFEEARQAITRVLEPLSRVLDGVPKKYALRVNPSDPDHAEEMLREVIEEIKRQVQDERGKKITKRKGIK